MLELYEWYAKLRKQGVEIYHNFESGDIFTFPATVSDEVRQQVWAEAHQRYSIRVELLKFHAEEEDLPDSPPTSTLGSEQKGSPMKVSTPKGKAFFSEVEDQGSARVRQEMFEIQQGSHVVARCVIAIIEEDNKPSKLYINVSPLDEIGVDLTKELILEGDVASTFAELVGAAGDLLSRHSRSRDRGSDRDIHVTLDIE